MLHHWVGPRRASSPAKQIVALILILGPIFLFSLLPRSAEGQIESFQLVEATIEDIHAAYNAGTLTARQLVQLYLDRIEAYDQQGPGINAIISVNSQALQEADRLDAAFESSGFVGPLHGIPVILKDQMNAAGMSTTLGSILFQDYYPNRDAFVIQQLKESGAINFGKGHSGRIGRRRYAWFAVRLDSETHDALDRSGGRFVRWIRRGRGRELRDRGRLARRVSHPSAGLRPGTPLSE